MPEFLESIAVCVMQDKRCTCGLSLADSEIKKLEVNFSDNRIIITVGCECGKEAQADIKA